jgi:hypothetical protein
MQKILLSLVFLTALMTTALAQASVPVNAPAVKDATTPIYSVAKTKIGDLLDKPALRAIFEKYLPEVANGEHIDQARDVTLPEIVQYAPDLITPSKLAAIDMELKALPPQ